LMIVHYVAGAALSEMHGSVLPRSAFSTVTSGGQEDHVSMGATACFNLLRVLDRFVDVLACEALIACEAMEDLPVQPSQAVQTLHKQVRSVAEPLTEDRSTSGELESIGAALRTGSWHALVQSLHPEP